MIELKVAHRAHRNSALPAVLSSASDWTRARRKTPIPDHADYLSKPFAIGELLALVVRLTGYPWCAAKPRSAPSDRGVQHDRGSECRRREGRDGN